MKISKKFSIILFIILILFSFTVTSFGWQGVHLGFLDGYVQYDENGDPKFMMPYEIMDYLIDECPDFQYYRDGTYDILICKNGWSTNTGRWYICFLDPTTKVWLTGGNDPYLQSDKEIFYYRCNDDGNYNWEKVQGSTMNVYPAGEYVDGKIVYCGASTITVYNSDQTTPFFQGAPLTGRLGVEILRHQVNLNLVLMEILKILPLILVVMVSLIGFRKAWNLLSTILKTS